MNDEAYSREAGGRHYQCSTLDVELEYEKMKIVRLEGFMVNDDNENDDGDGR